MMEPNVLTQDCLPYLANAEENSFDVVLTDPPYPNGSGYFMDRVTDAIAALYLAAKKTKKHIIFFWTPLVDPPRPPPEWRWTSTIIWNKPDGKTSIGYERIIIWSRDYKRLAYKVLSVPIVDYRSLDEWTKKHPTAKPVRLMRILTTMYTEPGDLILDPFAGIGSTAIAAAQLKRRCIAIEHNPEYAHIATQRLQPYQLRATEEAIDELPNHSEDDVA